MDNVVIKTIIPIILLMGTGFLARNRGILKSGDERVLSAYVYYFALPALFFVNMAETVFTSRETLRFILAGIIPVLVALMIYLAIYFIFSFSKDTLYLLVLSTVFGSLAFFGIPFIMFAFPTRQGEHLAILSAASISMISVIISIMVLELYKLEQATIGEGLKLVAKRLSKNPLIISILCGVLLSLMGIKVPSPLSNFLHMLGGTTAAVAIFMLGVFLYGRRYADLARAFKLSMLRIIFLPAVALVTTRLITLPDMENSILVLMHGMPVAISMIVLSERYDFYQETIASLILISSIGAALYLNLWLLVLGYP